MCLEGPGFKTAKKQREKAYAEVRIRRTQDLVASLYNTYYIWYAEEPGRDSHEKTEEEPADISVNSAF